MFSRSRIPVYVGTDIKSPQSTTSNISTHSTQSNHSTVSTDSTGYGPNFSSPTFINTECNSLLFFSFLFAPLCVVCPCVSLHAQTTSVYCFSSHFYLLFTFRLERSNVACQRIFNQKRCDRSWTYLHRRVHLRFSRVFFFSWFHSYKLIVHTHTHTHFIFTRSRFFNRFFSLSTVVLYNPMSCLFFFLTP